MSRTLQETVDVVVEEKVPFAVLTAGNPAPYIPLLKKAGIPFFAVVATVKQALKMEEMGACLIVAEGEESGGHIGPMTTMALIPQTASALKSVPVVAAGGIADGRGMAAAFMLGAEGIQMGSAFMVSSECTIHKNVKNAIIEADSGSIVVAKRRIARPVRGLNNALMKSFAELDTCCAPKEDYDKLWAGSCLRASKDGDTENGSIMVGQIVGLIKEERSASAIIQGVLAEYNSLRQTLPEISR
ncbi:MAG: nitronate monooxygenase family protein [Treponema sp.]|nr:nitronate monooxygenase family protein [Treponema sp.]